MLSRIMKIFLLLIKIILGLIFEFLWWFFCLIFFWKRYRLYIYEFGVDDIYPSRLSVQDARKRQIRNRRARNDRQKMRKRRKKS